MSKSQDRQKGKLEMKERYQIVEDLLAYAIEAEQYIKSIDKRFEKTVLECGPSGYVGCSHECRGAGLRRRSGHTEDIVDYLYEMGKKKDQMILFLRPLVCAFDDMKRTRSGHIIYYCVGKGLSSQEYGERFNYSRRHTRRLYLKAMEDLFCYILRNGGKTLLNKFSE